MCNSRWLISCLLYLQPNPHHSIPPLQCSCCIPSTLQGLTSHSDTREVSPPCASDDPLGLAYAGSLGSPQSICLVV
ncbi:hypothetical protein YC2023_071654 [Brassica napus]